MKVEFDVDEYIKLVTKNGVRRKKAQGKLDEADYACGAMNVLFYLKMQDKMPADWIFGIMGGKEVFVDGEDS